MRATRGGASRRPNRSAPYTPYGELRNAPAPDGNNGPRVGSRYGEGLDLSNCGLTRVTLRLPQLFGQTLRELSLQKNSLKEISSEVLSRLPLLEVLDVSYNSITTLPVAMGRLENLRELNVSCNLITDLPLVIFGRLFRLERLVVDGNPLVTIPISLLQGGARGFFRYACDSLAYPQHATDRLLEQVMAESVQEVLLRDGSHAKVSVVCYNVLAEMYATPERHPYCPSWALEWSYRKVRILNQLVYLNADVVCLQEVEAGQFRDFFLPNLGSAGYDGVFRPKSRARTMSSATELARVDGCAIFWRRAVMGLAEEHVIEFQDMASQRGAEFRGEGLNRLILKDNIALVALLELWPTSSSPGGRVLVANTHIHWNPEFSDVKLVQTQLFLEKLTELRVQYSRRNSGVSLPLIVAGDFNSTPDSGVFTLVTTGRLSPTHAELRSQAYGRYSASGMTHDLDLMSCYADKTLTYTNYTHDFRGVLDYVFVTRDCVHVLSVLMPLSETQLTEHCPAIPNGHWPSDHVLLYVQLVVKVAP